MVVAVAEADVLELVLELVLEEDCVTVVDKDVELLATELELEAVEETEALDEADELEGLTSLAPQIPGASTAAPRLFLR